MFSPRKPLTIGGVEYPSQTALAIGLGVDAGLVSRHLRNKNYAALERIAASGKARQEKPVTVLGVEYPSRKAAAEALGVRSTYVSHLATAERQDALDRLATVGKVSRPIPVVLRGVEYPTVRAAARAFDVKPGRLRQQILNGNEVAVERILDGWTHNTAPVPVTILGVEYPSQTAAARAYGSHQTCISVLMKHGRVDAWAAKKLAKANRTGAGEARCQ